MVWEFQIRKIGFRRESLSGKKAFLHLNIMFINQ